MRETLKKTNAAPSRKPNNARLRKRVGKRLWRNSVVARRLHWLHVLRIAVVLGQRVGDPRGVDHVAVKPLGLEPDRVVALGEAPRLDLRGHAVARAASPGIGADGW